MKAQNKYIDYLAVKYYVKREYMDPHLEFQAEPGKKDIYSYIMYMPYIKGYSENPPVIKCFLIEVFLFSETIEEAEKKKENLLEDYKKVYPNINIFSIVDKIKYNSNYNGIQYKKSDFTLPKSPAIIIMPEGEYYLTKISIGLN